MKIKYLGRVGKFSFHLVPLSFRNAWIGVYIEVTAVCAAHISLIPFFPIVIVW